MELKVKRKPYFYTQELKRLIVQVCSVFAGFQVQTGIVRDGNTRFIDVPVVYGPRDNVTTMYLAGGSQNSLVSLPIISIRMTQMAQASELRRDPGHTRIVYYTDRNLTPVSEENTEVAGTPRKLGVRMHMPVPYKINFELMIWASNQDQLIQLVEQISTLYNPLLDLKLSDNPLDWTSITNIKFNGNVNFTRQAPDIGQGTQKTPNIATLEFEVLAQLNPPAMVFNADDIESIHLQLKQLDGEERINWDNLETIDTIVVRGS